MPGSGGWGLCQGNVLRKDLSCEDQAIRTSFAVTEFQQSLDRLHTWETFPWPYDFNISWWDNATVPFSVQTVPEEVSPARSHGSLLDYSQGTQTPELPLNFRWCHVIYPIEEAHGVVKLFFQYSPGISLLSIQPFFHFLCHTFNLPTCKLTYLPIHPPIHLPIHQFILSFFFFWTNTK